MVAVSFQKKRERSKNEVRRKYILSTVKEIGLGKMNKLLKQIRTKGRFKKITCVTVGGWGVRGWLHHQTSTVPV